MSLSDELFNIKKKIEEKEIENAKNEAMLEILLDELTRMGHTTIDGAREYLQKLDKVFEEVQKNYENKLLGLEKKYGQSTII